MFLICNSLEASIWRETNPRPPSSLSRVTSSSLDPRKHWYVLTKEVCRGYPKDFARNEIFKSFPDELRSVAARELQPAKSAYSSNFQRTPNKVYVASTFGLIAGLLRQSGRSASGVLNSAVFTPIVNLLNSIALDMEHRDAMDFAFGGKACPVIQESEELYAELAEKSRSIEFLELKLKNLQGQVADLETSLSDFSSSEPTCCSTPVDSRSSSCCSSIEETKRSPDLGSTTKKRQVVGLFIRDFRIRAWHNRPKQKEIYEFFSAFSFTKCSVCL